MTLDRQGASLILFASADRYQTLQALVSVIGKHLPADKNLHVLDMSGERLSSQDTANNWTLIYFNHGEVTKTIWEILNPHAIEWWKLLNLHKKTLSNCLTFQGLKI